MSKRLKLEEVLKELTLTPAQLQEKFAEIGVKFSVRSKTLAEEQVDALKDHLKSKKQVTLGEVRRGDLIEKRVMGSVIRRRRVELAPGETQIAPGPTLEKEVEKKVAPDKEEISSKPALEKEASRLVGVQKTKPSIQPKLKVVEEAPKPISGKELSEEEKILAQKKAEKLLLDEAELAKKRRKAFISRRTAEFDINQFGRSERLYQPKKKKVVDKSRMQSTQLTMPKAAKRVIKISGQISISDLATELKVKSSEIIQKLMAMGMMVTLNQKIDAETAALIAQEYQYEIQNEVITEEHLLKQSQISESMAKPRFPVVTVMGHVDHGKTSLLDAIRQTDVVAQEAGGITQHIGASMVALEGGRRMTFIDTPGHEAFSAMRARGAKTTDIVILVVAADDGIMPQTKEAIAHAREAQVPIVVAINKIDKPGANVERVKKQLSEVDLLSEDWGGKTIVCEISAKQKTGIKELLEMIWLQAEVLELKAAPDIPATGVVLEAKLAKGLGPVATILVQQGTLKRGDFLVMGDCFGKARLLMDDKGKMLDQAGPAFAIEISGLESVPRAGETFYAFKQEADAKALIHFRATSFKTKEVEPEPKLSLESLYEKMQQGNLEEVKFIVKADVQGSVEVVKDIIEKLKTEKIKTKVIFASAGAITESDVHLAAASHAILIGFNIRPDSKAKELIKTQKVDARLYEIIYDVSDDLKKALLGKLEPEHKEVFLGRAEIRQIFKVSKVGQIAGCFVTEGVINRKAHVRLLRDNKIIYTGRLSSLKRFKDDAREVAQGFECGLGIENYNDLKLGDTIEAFVVEEVVAGAA
ncbi:MAG: translation initiation factor IF-2 [Deltaproteobacteria bacterium]|nr:translation initiation factor IF-2 [Deltaproteobacteria bacterium]